MIKRTFTRSHRQHGIAAVEFAAILPVIGLLLAFILFFGRVFMHYTVALKTAGDVATFIAQARSQEMLEARPDLGEIAIVGLARSIGATELAELNPGNGGHAILDISCDGSICRGAQVPDQIIVLISMRMYDPFLPTMLLELGDMDGIWVRAEVRVRYVGV